MSDGKKREPRTTVYDPRGVSQIGEQIGNHATDSKSTSNYKGDRVRMGAPHSAPAPDGVKNHHCGSQGKH